MARGTGVDQVLSADGNDPLWLTPAQDPGDEFEKHCWELLRRRYPPEQLFYFPADMGGDYGIEGYSADGIAYQCYADRDSQTLRHRTDKQKAKLYEDTCKLKKYAGKLGKALGDTIIENYFLMVPEYHAVELLEYAFRRAEAVKGFDLGFISTSFAIHIKTPKDYPGELRAALMDRSATALVAEPQIGEHDLTMFVEEKPNLIQVIDEKLAVLQSINQDVDVIGVRDQLVRSFLIKEQIMESLKDWPGTWESVERRRQLRQDALELESELDTDPANKRLLVLIREYQRDLLEKVGGIREPDAQRLAHGQIGEWLMRCPLRFRRPE